MIASATGIIRTNRRNNKEYRKLLHAAKSGEVIKMRNGLYIDADAAMSDLIDIKAIVPGGILCMYSAWSYYNLTTQIPDAFYIAVERSRKIRLAAFPTIKLVFESEKILNIGHTTITRGPITADITDLERSVCDAVKYRNKIGIDVMAEILDNYLKKSDRDITRLYRYAKSLRIANILSTYLAVKI